MDNSAAGKRRRRFYVIITTLLYSVILCVPGLGFAQDLEISGPEEDPPLAWGIDGSVGIAGYNFGSVVVGESETATFHLTSMGPTAVWIYVIELGTSRDLSGTWISPQGPTPHYTLGAFSFNQAKPLRDGSDDSRLLLPIEMPIGLDMLVDIIFSPESLGDYGAYLYVHSNDSVGSPGMHAYIHLTGTAVPLPASLLLLVPGLVGLAAFKRKRK